MGRIVSAAVFIALALILPASAAAQRCEAPPGTGAVDQYCEVVPNATGDTADGGNGSGTTPGISRSTSRELSGSGSDGKALMEYLGGGKQGVKSDEATGNGSSGRGSQRGGDAGDSTSPRTSPSSNPLAAVASAADDGAVLGGPLAWALLAITLAAIGVMVVRASASRRGQR